MTRIACQQLEPTLGDVEANRRMALAAIRQAADAGADVVVLPELVTSGYVFNSPEEAAEAAIDPGGDLIGEWAALAAEADIVLAAGFCERGDGGRLYNSLALIDRSGVRAIYRKLHLWDREKLLFTPGDCAPPVVDTRVGRVGALICYDLEFPELTRSLALAGVQLLLVPTNWPLVPRPVGEHPPEVVIAMAAARVNRMAVACADRLGTERGQAWTGGTSIVGVDGWVAAESREPGLVRADLELEEALDKRLAEGADAFADRRPGFYAAIAQGADADAGGIAGVRS